MERFQFPDESTSDLGANWEKWKRSFQYYLDGRGINQDARKRALLLHSAGPRVQTIFETLDDTGNTYASAIQSLDTYFQPLVNKYYERYRFRQIRQQQGEAIDRFVSRLRQQAAKCSFADSDENILDQLIEKCDGSRVRSKLLEEGNDLTLEKAISLARTLESVAAQERDISSQQDAGPSTERTLRVESTWKDRQAKSKGKPQAKKPQHAKQCSRCGLEGHGPTDAKCPAKKVECNKCHKQGHYARMCKTKSNSSKTGKVLMTEESQCKQGECLSKSDSEYVFAVNHEHATAVIRIGGVDTQVVIDSGACSNIMSQQEFTRLKHKGMKYKSCKVKKTLYTYGSTRPLSVVGGFDTEVASEGKQMTTQFIVVRCSGPTLLGRQTAPELHLLTLGSVREDNTLGRKELIEEYSDCFSGLGKLKDFQLKIHIDESVTPVAQQPRRIPFGLRDKVEAELNHLLEADVIEEVQGPTSWISPVVVIPKKGGQVRICVDMRRANEAVIRERHPIPTVDEVVEELRHSKHFSRLDLKKGFHQVELDETSRPITTFVTHKGLFRYKRLMFGVSSAPEAYQRIIQQTLSGCEGTTNISDDILVHGVSKAEHDLRLRAVLDRIRDRGLTLNAEKCDFDMDKLKFMGHVISKEGISPADDKVASIMATRDPKTATEVRSFLGIVNFCAKFIPDLATIADPLRKCARANQSFVWTKTEAEAFATIKNRLRDATALAVFDRTAHTSVVADASPVGLGAVLWQEQDGIKKPISYASRSLTDVERRYSQTEKEALGLVWACERFNLYLAGRKFDLITDHRPLQTIYGPRSKPSARIERWVLRLQPYDFNVIYTPGKYNIADPLSRLSLRDQGGENDEYIKFVAREAAPSSISPRQIEEASKEDSELQSLRRSIREGNQANVPANYKHVFGELTIVGYIVLRNCRIVIPTKLRNQVLQLAHEGHQGITKCKDRLRTKVWWPGVDREMERMCRTCHACQITQLPSHPPPMKRTQLPTGPWITIAADILGPLPTGEYLLVVVDYYSRYFEVDLLKRIRASDIISRLKTTFSRYGAPYTMITDNGSQFMDHSFECFLKDYGVEHSTSPPLWPRANGEVERQNRTLLHAMQTAQVEGKDWRQELYIFLMAYRTTPHSTTGISPADAFFQRKVRCKLPTLGLQDTPVFDGHMRDEDLRKKEEGKRHGDIAVKAQTDDIKVGDKVLLRQQKTNKLTTTYEWQPYNVISRAGAEVVISNGNKTLRRHIFHTRPYEEGQTPSVQEKESTNDLDEHFPTQQAKQTTKEGRPRRERQPPVRLKDYSLS